MVTPNICGGLRNIPNGYLVLSTQEPAWIRPTTDRQASSSSQEGANWRAKVVLATSWAVLAVVIAVLSTWAHHSLSTARSAKTTTAAGPPASASAPPPTSVPMRMQLRAWLAEAEPSINALVTVRDNIAAAAARKDVTGTGVACRTAGGAVANSQQHMPSPDPALNAALQQAIIGYQAGLLLPLRYAESGPGRPWAGSDLYQSGKRRPAGCHRRSRTRPIGRFTWLCRVDCVAAGVYACLHQKVIAELGS